MRDGRGPRFLETLSALANLPRQRRESPIVLLQERREVRALTQRDPNALELKVRDDVFLCFVLADAHAELELPRSVWTEYIGIDDDIIGAANNGARDAHDLSGVPIEVALVH